MRFLRVIPMVLALLCCLTGAGVAGAEVTVRAAVDQQEVFVGETFILQIQVEGSEAPEEPDTSPLSDFAVEPRGGGQNSEFKAIIDGSGRMDRVSRRGYLFNYGLTPRKAGRLVIPSLTVRVEGQEYRTEPIPIQVKEPQETAEFKLRQTLDKDRAYVGEPVTMTVTWYIGKDVNGFTFNLPILSDPRFVISDGQEGVAHLPRDQVVRIPAPGGEILAEKGNGVLDGNNFLTVSFTRTLIAKEPGTLTLPQATVSCQALSGYRHGGRDPFGGLFPDDLFGRSRQYYQTVVVPSNEPTLEVLPLPTEGRPAAFSGLVGTYSLALSATPTTVKVGDPITLTIQVAGPAVVGVTLPPLAEALGASDFKVPEEMAPGEGSGELKTFTQTVRAKHAGVKAIPPLRLTFFNPASGRYETASSQPVPLTVSEARAVTAQDAEGASPAGEPAKQEVKVAKGGINYNYEGPELLTTQTPSATVTLTTLWYTLLLLPPALFLLVVVATLVSRYGQRDPQGRASRQALGRLSRAVEGISPHGDPASGYQALGRALREYLGAKLHRNPAALTYADCEPLLVNAGASGETLSHLREVLSGCEAFEYAGAGSGAGDLARLVELARQVAGELERVV